MTTNKPEVVAWRWRKPVVNDQGETVGATAWELSDAPGFLPWWTNDPLVRLSDYQRLQVERDKLCSIISDIKDWDCDVSGGFLSIPVGLRRRMQDALAAYRQGGGE